MCTTAWVTSLGYEHDPLLIESAPHNILSLRGLLLSLSLSLLLKLRFSMLLD